MNDQKMEQGYWSVIPAEVLDDRELSASAKLFYAKLSGLARRTGFCYASNEWLANELKAGERTISGWLRELDGKGYIHIILDKTQNGTKRRIYVGAFASLALAEICECGQKPASANNVFNNIKYPPVAPQGAKRARKRPEPRKAPTFEPERFEKFWAYYPAQARRDKQAAMDEWDALEPTPGLIDEIAVGLKQLRATDAWQRGVGIPYPCRFLRRRLWEDGLALLHGDGEEPDADDDIDVTGGMVLL